jgi:hypothetical protein
MRGHREHNDFIYVSCGDQSIAFGLQAKSSNFPRGMIVGVQGSKDGNFHPTIQMSQEFNAWPKTCPSSPGGAFPVELSEGLSHTPSQATHAFARQLSHGILTAVHEVLGTRWLWGIKHKIKTRHKNLIQPAQTTEAPCKQLIMPDFQQINGCKDH